MKTIATSHPLPGKTQFHPIERAQALAIAQYFYDVLTLSLCDGGSYAVQTASGFAAIVFTDDHGRPAILHKINGGRILEVLELNQETDGHLAA